MDYLAGHKRKRHDNDSDDDAKPTNQALPVAHIPDDFSGEPLDGETYLALVRRDARRLPHVTRVPNPYAASSYVAASSGGSAIPVPTSQQHDLARSSRFRVPSAEWRASFEKRFLNFRKNLQHRPIYVGRPPPRPVLPKLIDRNGWWAFLNEGASHEAAAPQAASVLVEAARLVQVEQDFLPTGRAQPQHEVTLSYEDDEDEDGEVKESAAGTPERIVVDAAALEAEIQDEDEDEVDEPATEVPVRGAREPTRAILEYFDHKLTIQLIKYYRHWLTSAAERRAPHTYLHPAHGRWLFALLAHTEPVLTADDMSHVRQLARAAIALLHASRNEDEEECAGLGQGACWMIVAAVAGVWAQRDLWDDATTAIGA